jgi:PUA domain protein
MLNMNAVDLFGLQSHIEVIESERIRIFLINGRPLLLQYENVLLPTLLFSEAMGTLPKIIVDMGAVPYVCKGADVMAPGIVRIEGEFERGQLVVVSDEKHGKPLSLGESLVDSEKARTIKQGPVIKNLHYVSDKFWQLLKTVGGS